MLPYKKKLALCIACRAFWFRRRLCTFPSIHQSKGAPLKYIKAQNWTDRLRIGPEKECVRVHPSSGRRFQLRPFFRVYRGSRHGSMAYADCQRRPILKRYTGLHSMPLNRTCGNVATHAKSAYVGCYSCAVPMA